MLVNKNQFAHLLILLTVEHHVRVARLPTKSIESSSSNRYVGDIRQFYEFLGLLNCDCVIFVSIVLCVFICFGKVEEWELTIQSLT
jgi:hypothetical protein